MTLLVRRLEGHSVRKSPAVTIRKNSLLRTQPSLDQLRKTWPIKQKLELLAVMLAVLVRYIGETRVTRSRENAAWQYTAQGGEDETLHQQRTLLSLIRLSRITRAAAAAAAVANFISYQRQSQSKPGVQRIALCISVPRSAPGHDNHVTPSPHEGRTDPPT